MPCRVQPSARLLAAVHLAQWRAVREAAKGEEDMAAASAGMPRLTFKGRILRILVRVARPASDHGRLCTMCTKTACF
jgi:hypothetical protein